MYLVNCFSKLISKKLLTTSAGTKLPVIMRVCAKSLCLLKVVHSTQNKWVVNYFLKLFLQSVSSRF